MILCLNRLGTTYKFNNCVLRGNYYRTLSFMIQFRVRRDEATRIQSGGNLYKIIEFFYFERQLVGSTARIYYRLITFVCFGHIIVML